MSENIKYKYHFNSIKVNKKANIIVINKKNKNLLIYPYLLCVDN